jgi:DNA-binding NarL/FixJ family response regulator
LLSQSGSSYTSSMAIKRNLLIVEDEPMVAALLSESLSNEDFEIRTATSVKEAISITKNFDPDIAILDINLGRGLNGVDLAFILSKQHPGIALLLLTQHPDLRTAGFEKKDLPQGCGFMRKQEVTSRADILKAIDSLVAPNVKQVRQDVNPDRPLASLTPTQVEVLRMVAQGFTNQEIGKQRNTSTRAVEGVLNAIFLNLGIDNSDGINQRVEAVRIFIAAAGTPERS